MVSLGGEARQTGSRNLIYFIYIEENSADWGAGHKTGILITKEVPLLQGRRESSGHSPWPQ